MISTNTTTTRYFTEQANVVKDFIKEKDSKSSNAPSVAVHHATHLLIAIENAENIFEAYPDKTPFLKGKKEEFEKMIACLSKLDFNRLNLSDRIRHSIDSGTHEGWIPKLYAVNPQHIVPTKEFTIQFFGKFKYASYQKHVPTLTLGKNTFIPNPVQNLGFRLRQSTAIDLLQTTLYH